MTGTCPPTSFKDAAEFNGASTATPRDRKGDNGIAGVERSNQGSERRVIWLRERYRITLGEAARFAGTLADAAHLVEPLIVEPVVLSDPDDDPVLYTAADGNADILCTLNAKHFTAPVVLNFCTQRGIPVMTTDVEVLRELQALTGSGSVVS